MINKISSSIPTFKEICFHSGLNILVTDKSVDSTSTNTRNGSGKSSLIDIIHFLFGASVDKNSIFKKEELADSIFDLDFTVEDIAYTVERSTVANSKILLTTHLPEGEQKESHSLANLNSRYLEILFGIKDDKVSFRGAFSYFIRQEGNGGFSDPIEIHKKQNKLSKQASLSFLFGLNTQIPLEWKELKRKETELNVLKKALKNKTVNILKSEGEINTTLTILNEKINRLESQLHNFQILPKYRDLEHEADKLTIFINEATNNSQILSSQIHDIRKSSESEDLQQNISIETLYNEVNVVLPQNIVKRFEDVRKFHESVVNNRKNYLMSEIKEIEDEISVLRSNIDRWSIRKEEIMQTLNDKGALDQFLKIQQELNKLKSEYTVLSQQLNVIHSIENTKAEINQKSTELQQRLNEDILDNEEVIKRAILSFSHAARFLYGEEDTAKIIIDKKGKDGINIEIIKSDKKSKGIHNMMVFCFDMMLMEINMYLERPLDFMVHDSHLFDGVDERQIELALTYAKLKSEELGFQYITMLNSDTYKGFESQFEEHRIKIDISDATESGGIFGFRF
ncbi:DUF2326 domain-containing protein [Sporosarcina saromensis]|uniref:DUF2326 domain-containing protein n=1 Tax=Sporosarcina saromensis TaxID=359365 RepID=A0ABU4G3P6_9BACL|nr:DUF2326 domain-containing protein [Sporosarcina saromensis]MDW0111589.1 DUF2326 domain-containing protein [Sporosarcina saromensis]